MIESLTKAIRNNRLSHAYIIEGDELTDKLGFSYEFAKSIFCGNNPGIGCNECRSCRMINEKTYRDIYLIATDEKSVKDKDIEELQDRLGKLPLEDGGRNIAIIDNADTMTTRAQNRLLKSLEEPHPGTVIMLLSENSDMLLPTIRSRCQVIRLYDYGETEEGSESREIAKTLIDLSKRGRYFFEKKEILDMELKDKKTAIALLDGLEREFRDRLVKVASNSNPDSTLEEELAFCRRGIEAVERARKDLRYNVREKYSLGELMLRIGG